jgi:hypothetical protein
MAKIEVTRAFDVHGTPTFVVHGTARSVASGRYMRENDWG